MLSSQLCREGFDRDLPEFIGLLGEGDVSLDVGCLQPQLVRLHIDALKHRWKHQRQRERAPNDQRRRGQRKPERPHLKVGP